MEQAFNTFIGCWTISNIIGLIGGALVGFGISYGVPRRKRCIHTWNLIEEGSIFRYDSQGNPKEKVGLMKFYECSHCKKMRKETITI